MTSRNTGGLTLLRWELNLTGSVFYSSGAGAADLGNADLAPPDTTSSTETRSTSCCTLRLTVMKGTRLLHLTSAGSTLRPVGSSPLALTVTITAGVIL